jgi:hypothetical protein
MFDGDPNDFARPLDIDRPRGRPVGQNKQPMDQIIRDRQSPVPEWNTSPVRLHLVTPGEEVPPGDNVFRKENVNKFIASQRTYGWVHVYNHVMTIV